MCGRFTLKTPPAQWVQLLLPVEDFATIAEGWQPRYNIAPTQNIIALARGRADLSDDASVLGKRGDGTAEQEPLAASYFRWGLVPGWATELSIGNRMINARSETLSEKRSFQRPLKERRCLILADGYYEWKKLDNGTKQPYWITPADAGVIQFAGLWEVNRKATGEPIYSCTIITTPASNELQSIHDRMPAVLLDAAAEQWMDPHDTSPDIATVLGPAEEGFFEARAVSQHVNNPRHEDPACIQPT